MNEHQLTDTLGQIELLKWIIVGGGSALTGAVGAMALYIKGELSKQNEKYIAMVERTTATVQHNNDLYEQITENCPCAGGKPRSQRD